MSAPTSNSLLDLPGVLLAHVVKQQAPPCDDDVASVVSFSMSCTTLRDLDLQEIWKLFVTHKYPCQPPQQPACWKKRFSALTKPRHKQQLLQQLQSAYSFHLCIRSIDGNVLGVCPLQLSAHESYPGCAPGDWKNGGFTEMPDVVHLSSGDFAGGLGPVLPGNGFVLEVMVHDHGRMANMMRLRCTHESMMDNDWNQDGFGLIAHYEVSAVWSSVLEHTWLEEALDVPHSLGWQLMAQLGVRVHALTLSSLT